MAINNRQSIITEDLLFNKFKNIVPISQSNPEMVMKIREWGKERALAASNAEGLYQ